MVSTGNFLLNTHSLDRPIRRITTLHSATTVISGAVDGSDGVNRTIGVGLVKTGIGEEAATGLSGGRGWVGVADCAQRCVTGFLAQGAGASRA